MINLRVIKKGGITLNVAKFVMSDCGHVCAHYERAVKPGHYSNKDIDEAKIHMDYNLGPKREIKQTEYIKQMLSEIDHVHRKDLVVMATIVLNAPKTLPYDQHERFFKLSYQFFINRYGKGIFENPENICISCYRHQSESTDHIHFAMLPINKASDGTLRFQAREKINREDLKTLHQDLDAYLRENGMRCEILNGNTKRDAYGRALSIKELKKQTYNRKFKIKHKFQGGRF